MPSAWTYQRPEQVRELGPELAPWYVGWYEPDGRRKGQKCGVGFKGQKLAQRKARQLEGELLTGSYQSQVKKTWADFRAEYEQRIVAGMALRSQVEVIAALAHFERIVNPIKVSSLTTTHVDGFIAIRRLEPGKKKGDLVSPATVNKDLRHVKAALKVAKEWGYLSREPRFRMEKEPGKLPRYITGEHFAQVYAACDQARRPAGLPYPAADWWRGLLVMGYMTGWRINELLSFRRDDLDLDRGEAITWHEDNKGKRDERVKLHPVVVEHLVKLTGFRPFVFPWDHDRTTLMNDFGRLQRAAGIKLPCRGKHEHTDACHVYGFHDLRRAFATMNADRLSADALQALMRHKSYLTTQRYINMGRQLDDAVASLHVPDVLKSEKIGG